MNILTIGLNHHTAPVALREKLAFTEAQAGECLRRVRELGLAEEAVVLSTCNRVEFYHVWNCAPADRELAEFIGQFHKVDRTEFEKSLYFHRDQEAVRHLFRVASGLDSMVVGETEVLGQVKKAYQLAHSLQSTGPVLNALFQRSFYVAKRLQSETKIHEGRLSVSSVAVELARKIFGDLSSKIVLLIGAGKVSEQTVARLMERGVRGLIASNRSFEKARNLAQRFGGEAIGLDDLHQKSGQVDIVISSTAAPHFILRKDEVARWMHQRRQRSLFIIDIAVPRDVDPEVNALDNVYLYNIDDLKGMARTNLDARLEERTRCEEMIRQEVLRFMERFKGSDGDNPTTSLSSRSERPLRGSPSANKEVVG